MPPEGMNSDQLRWVMSRRPVSRQTPFLGMFAADQLPALETVPRPSGLIVNTDKSHLPDKHWVAMYYGINGRDEFFLQLRQITDVVPRSVGATLELELSVQHAKFAARSHHGVWTLLCVYLQKKQEGKTLQWVVGRFKGPTKMADDRRVCQWVCGNLEVVKARRHWGFVSGPSAPSK